MSTIPTIKEGSCFYPPSSIPVQFSKPILQKKEDFSLDYALNYIRHRPSEEDLCACIKDQNIENLIYQRLDKQKLLESTQLLYQKFAENFDQYSSSFRDPSKKNVDSSTQYHFFIFQQKFNEQNEFDKPLTFVKDFYYKQRIFLDITFIKNAEQFKLCHNVSEALDDLDAMVKTSCTQSSTISNKKMIILAALVQDFIFELYQIRKSFWHPEQPIDSLIGELSIHGPLLIRGKIGPMYYKESPVAIDIIDDREIYSWESKAKKRKIDTICSFVIIGSLKHTETIYFIDPTISYKKSTMQKIYAISLKELRKNIFDLDGSKPYISSLFLSEKVEENHFALYNSLFKKSISSSSSSSMPSSTSNNSSSSSSSKPVKIGDAAPLWYTMDPFTEEWLQMK